MDESAQTHRSRRGACVGMCFQNGRGPFIRAMALPGPLKYVELWPFLAVFRCLGLLFYVLLGLGKP